MYINPTKELQMKRRQNKTTEKKNKEGPQYDNIHGTAKQNANDACGVLYSQRHQMLGECTDLNHTAAEHTRTAAIFDTQPHLHTANTNTETGGDRRQQRVDKGKDRTRSEKTKIISACTSNVALTVF